MHAYDRKITTITPIVAATANSTKPCILPSPGIRNITICTVIDNSIIVITNLTMNFSLFENDTALRLDTVKSTQR